MFLLKSFEKLSTMRNIFLLILLLTITSVHAQNKASVWVLGTVHFETKGIKVDSVFNAIETFKPDIILLESDMTNFNSDYSLKNNYNEVEWIVMNRYKKKYSKTLVRPYEFEGRNQYRKDNGIQNINNVFHKLYEFNQKGQLTKSQSKTWNRFMVLVDSLNKVGSKSLSTINNIETDNLVFERQFYQYAKALEIAEKIPYFSQNFHTTSKGEKITLLERLRRYCEFETLRNKVMADNVLNWTKQHPGKRIVVFTGFYHKAFLEQYLNWEQKNCNFRLVKYNQVFNEN